MSRKPIAPRRWNPPVVFAEHVESITFQAGALRLLLAADAVDRARQFHSIVSGELVLTVEGALELRTQLDQMLTQLEQKGVIQLPRGPASA